MTNYLIGAVLLLGGAYGAVEAWPLVVGPTLAIDVPADAASFPDGIVGIRGKAVRAAKLTINGEPALHDQEGNFSSTLTFPRGGSILTFEAQDRFGRTVTATRSIFVPADASAGSPTQTSGLINKN